MNHPDDGVKTRYHRLGFSIGTAHRLKTQLINQHWLEEQIVDLGRTRKVILRLTQQSKKALKLDASDPQHGSIVHEYWKRFYAQRFREKGYQVQFEVPRKSGRVDVVATRNSEKIAIEIETGKSNYIRNVQQNLSAGYDKIIVVATDKKAFEKVEQDLAQVGLLGLSRIDLVLASG